MGKKIEGVEKTLSGSRKQLYRKLYASGIYGETWKADESLNLTDGT